MNQILIDIGVTNKMTIGFMKGMLTVISILELDVNNEFPYEISKELNLDEIESLMYDFLQCKQNKKYGE